MTGHLRWWENDMKSEGGDYFELYDYFGSVIIMIWRWKKNKKNMYRLVSILVAAWFTILQFLGSLILSF